LIFVIFFLIIILPREPWYAHRHFDPVEAKAEAEQTKVLWWAPWDLGASLKYLEEQRDLCFHH
jgi:hypothetical protein